MMLEQKGLQITQEAALIVSFQWPLKLANGLNDPGYHGISAFVDHDPNFPNMRMDYNCGIRSYDMPSGYNHTGTVFLHGPFRGIRWMITKCWLLPWHRELFYIDRMETTIAIVD